DTAAATPGGPRARGWRTAPVTCRAVGGPPDRNRRAPCRRGFFTHLFREGSTYGEGRSQSGAAAGAGRGHRPGRRGLRRRAGEKRQGQAQGREGRGGV